MSQKTPVRDLLTDPAWSEADLGFPLPESPHACLVSLPTWEAVIGYEEGRPEVVERMQAGYPRFFIHPLTWRLFRELERRLAGPGQRVVAFPNPAAAERASRFVSKRGGQPGEIVEFDGLSALVVEANSYQAARDYWRHTGEIVSSRQAEDVLACSASSPEMPAAVRESLGATMGVAPQDVFLLESGMAAIFSLYRLITGREEARHKKTLQLSFPYVDALKIQEHFGCGVDFVSTARGESFRGALESIRSRRYAAVFCEVPSNPLCHTVDLPAVSSACREAGTPLLVDDTICSHANMQAFPWADAVSTSLTKWVSGIGDVMAGSVRTNCNSEWGRELRALLERDVPKGVRHYPRDAQALLSNARGFAERVADSNRGGEAAAEFLASHPAIDRVWYPKFVDRSSYDALRTDSGGYGGLLSFTLKRPERAPEIYAAMRFSKGPSLGTEYSLLCPYTLLAHYTELPWARQCGVARELLRLSVGREPEEEVIERLETGLAQA